MTPLYRAALAFEDMSTVGVPMAGPKKSRKGPLVPVTRRVVTLTVLGNLVVSLSYVVKVPELLVKPTWMSASGNCRLPTPPATLRPALSQAAVRAAVTAAAAMVVLLAPGVFHLTK